MTVASIAFANERIEPCAFIRDVSRSDANSYDQKIHHKDDGSVDINFGPKAPTGQEANWIPAMAGRG